MSITAMLSLVLTIASKNISEIAFEGLVYDFASIESPCLEACVISNIFDEIASRKALALRINLRFL